MWPWMDISWMKRGVDQQDVQQGRKVVLSIEGKETILIPSRFLRFGRVVKGQVRWFSRRDVLEGRQDWVGGGRQSGLRGKMVLPQL